MNPDSGPIILKPSDRPRKSKQRELITQAQAEKAAKELGMSVAKIGGLKDKARIGKYIEQLGATQIGRSTLLIAQHTAEQDLTKIDQFIAANDGGEICLIMDLYKLKAIYTDMVIRAAQAQMKLKGDVQAAQSTAPILPAFPPGTQIGIRLPESSSAQAGDKVVSAE